MNGERVEGENQADSWLSRGSHNHERMTWAETNSGTPNQLSHPGALNKITLKWIIDQTINAEIIKTSSGIGY